MSLPGQIELHALRGFVAVVDAGTVTEAALRIRVAQPALSRKIRLLEAELGAALFERAHSRLALTPAGRFFYVKCCSILHELDQAVARVPHCA